MNEFHLASFITTKPGTDGGTYNTIDEMDNTRIHRISTSAPIEHIKQEISEAYQNNGWVIMMSHVNSDGADDEKVREILRHSAIVGLEYVTLQEGFNRFGNLAQIGTDRGDGVINAVKADGSFTGSFRQVKYHSLLYDVPPNAPLEFFDRDVITVFPVNSPTAAEHYGLPSAGTIEVIHPFYSDYAFQRWTKYQDGETRVRTWNDTIGEWNDWEQISRKETNIRRTFDITIPANTSYKISSAANQPQGRIIFTQPMDNTNIPNGLSWNVLVLPNGSIQHIFHNTTESDINLSDVEWLVVIL